MKLIFSRWIGVNNPTPLILYIDLTAGCNLSCTYCGVKEFFNNQFSEPELTHSEIIEILKQAKQLGVRLVSFGGGEPLLREDLFDILNSAKRLGLQTHLNTNGTLITEKVSLKLNEAGLGAAAVSLDSHKAERHELFRGKGTYEPAINAVKYLREYAPATLIYINCTVGRHNLDDLEQLVEFAQKLGADLIKFTPVDTNLVHRFKAKDSYKDILLCPQDAKKAFHVFHKLRDLSVRNSIIGNSDKFLLGMAERLEKPVHTNCVAGYLFCLVDPWARVSPCYDVQSGMSLREHSLIDIWHSDTFKSLRREVRSCQRPCWDVGSAEPSLLLDPHIIRGKLRMIQRTKTIVSNRPE